MGSLMGKSETVRQTVRLSSGALTSDYGLRFLGHETVRPRETVRLRLVVPTLGAPADGAASSITRWYTLTP